MLRPFGVLSSRGVFGGEPDGDVVEFRSSV